uniref:Transcription factor protein n=1 Tax=Ciona intestinalis TaxID=7719 RepID=Q4H2P0_CIOIN|nr:transcription factor protein [Ciona intestinalis]BAE06737.1 transcription factor protein [Ciona intestinalis]|eukprot:NP_001071841.1 transcription factor protein [Ciona intestinalis]
MSSSSYNDSSFDHLSDSPSHIDVEMATNTLQISNPSSAASSVPNTDEEDEDTSDKHHQSYKERRREAHTQAEKKRREAIRKGYDELQLIVPNLVQQADVIGSQKLSKAVILQRSLNYVEFLQQQKKKQIEELNQLRKEKMALAIMKASYEQIVKQQMKFSDGAQGKVSEEVKFNIFQQVMEKLFVTFNSTITTNTFQDVSHGIINWIEEHCKPPMLRNIVNEVLGMASSTTYYGSQRF